MFQEIDMMKRLPVDGIAKASDGPPYEVLWISHGLVTTHYTTYSSPLSTHGASSPHSFHHDNRFRSHERYPITSIVHVQCSQHVRAASSLDESRESITVGSLGRQPETQSVRLQLVEVQNHVAMDQIVARIPVTSTAITSASAGRLLARHFW